MNRFRIAPSFEEAFEEMWRTRESYLDEVLGFKDFRFLRGPKDDKCTLYVSHSTWESHAAFEAWTNSDSFKQAHARAKSPEGMHLGPPNFEGFEVVL